MPLILNFVSDPINRKDVTSSELIFAQCDEMVVLIYELLA